MTDTNQKRRADYEQPTALSQVLSDMVGGGTSGIIVNNHEAAAAWYRANGDVERRHTMATYLTSEGDTTTLIVYIDSNVMLHDFTTKQALYKDRLENTGFLVDNIQFKLSRYQHNHTDEATHPQKEIPTDTLPELSRSEIDEIHKQTKTLPPELQDTVSEAMISVKRRERASMSDGK